MKHTARFGRRQMGDGKQNFPIKMQRTNTNWLPKQAERTLKTL